MLMSMLAITLLKSGWSGLKLIQDHYPGLFQFFRGVILELIWGKLQRGPSPLPTYLKSKRLVNTHVNWSMCCKRYIAPRCSGDRCTFREARKSATNLKWKYISSYNKGLNSEHFGYFCFNIPVPNWQFLIKVWASVIDILCLMSKILAYQKVCKYRFL